jgi:hypothetical protein
MVSTGHGKGLGGLSLVFGITALLCSAAAQQVPPPGSPIEEVARYWLERTSLPQALANPYEITPPGTVVSRGSSPLAQSMQLTTEMVVPDLPLDVFSRDSVIKFNRMLMAVLPVDANRIGGMPVTDATGKIRAAKPQSQAGALSIMLSISAWRQRAGLNTLFDDASNVYALHGATAVAARASVMNIQAMHTDRNPAYYLTPEAAIGLGGGLLAGYAPIGQRPTFNDGAHLRPIYNVSPYAVFGGATAGGLAQCIYIGGQAKTPTEMIKNGKYFLSAEGFAQQGTVELGGLYGYIKGMQFSPSGDNKNLLLKIYATASYPGFADRMEYRQAVNLDTATGIFSFPLPTGFGADYTIEGSKTPELDLQVDLRIEYRETLASPWKSIVTKVIATKPLTAEERLPHADILGMSRSNGADGLPDGRVKLVIVGKPGSELRIEGVAAQDSSDGPWSEVLTFNPNKPVTVVEMSENALPDGAQFLRVVTAKYHPSDAANARAAGISEDRILK